MVQEDVFYQRSFFFFCVFLGLPTEFPKVSSLSEIEIDQDKQALDSFLGPATESNNMQGNAEDEIIYMSVFYLLTSFG